MLDLIITGGEVLTEDGPAFTNVGVENGTVTAIGDNLGDAAVTIDADGAWVGPGFVDLHTHLREPGQEWKEDIGSGSAAAAAGGYTAIVAMPNTDPVIDSGHLARFVSDRGKQVGIVDVLPSGCLTMGRAGKTMAHIDELWEAGVRLFTDDGDAVGDASVLRLVMEYVAQYGGVVSQHAVDPSLSRAGHMHEGSVSSRLGMYGIPSEADDVVIARDLALARLTGVHYHVQHLSTAGGVALVAGAKAEGMPVTAEVTPHHLMFSHADVASTDSNFKMMPPLRSESDREALIAGLESGIIDAVATDHAPHAALEKEVPFEDAPNGVLGLEWAASVVTTMTGLGITEFFERMSIAPARILGRSDHGQHVAQGSDANLVVYRPDLEWTPTTSVSRSRNAPYFGRALTGAPVATVLRGVVTWERA
jgi:dihydroorotase